MKASAAVLAVLLFAGCAGKQIRNVRADFKAPDFVAMLPLDNQSNDLTAPRSVLGAMSSAMIGLGYFPISTPAQEAVLRKMGVTDGGQVRALSLSETASKLGVDGTMKGVITDFGKVNLGFYIQGKVAGTFSLHDASGETLWEGDGKFAESKVTLAPADALAAGVGELAGDLVGKIFKVHLVPESQAMAGAFVEKAKTNIPPLNYPGPGNPGK